MDHPERRGTGQQRGVRRQPLRTGRRDLDVALVDRNADRAWRLRDDGRRRRPGWRASRRAFLARQHVLLEHERHERERDRQTDERRDAIQARERREVVQEALERRDRDQHHRGHARGMVLHPDADAEENHAEDQPADRVGQILRRRPRRTGT